MSAVSESRVKHVCFTLQGQEYAADIADVKETMTVRPITRVFLTPPWLEGIINLRGDIVAVVDLSQFLSMPATVVTDDTRIVILQRAGPPRRTVGIVVDRMAELRSIDVDALEPVPATVGDTDGLLAGILTVDGVAVRVLDLAHLFESERLRQFRRDRSR
jgi:purine-binding chemotaxis protein CheW